MVQRWIYVPIMRCNDTNQIFFKIIKVVGNKMKVECPICGIMCFDNCQDEEKEMAQHVERKHGVEE